ncbi:hypothetical protein SLA2020_153110 [Shorea laevis]
MQMTVVEAYVGRKKINLPVDSSQLHPSVVSLFNEGIAQNSTGNVFVPKDGGDVEVSGSPTEKAILSWAGKLGMKEKASGVAVKRPDSEVCIRWEGAAEMVLASCTGYLDSNGCLQSIDEDTDFFKGAIDDMAACRLRCVAIAYRLYEKEKVPSDEESLNHWVLPEDNLVLLAIVGIKAPCHPGVKEAVKIYMDAGVKGCMVTRENLQTAKAIALEFAKKITVIGRSSSSDKLLLVQALRKGGDVVAVTGDGTNESPALHEADIGLSMGIQGTEVAKESSDIIILDDNFASVVKVVRWGHYVYANIQKFLQFQLTVNVAALVINVVAAVSSGDVPLNSMHL